MTRSLITLICPSSLERPVTDWLLEQEKIDGFTSSIAYGHGSDPHTLKLIEQVEGRKKQIMFQLHLPTEITNTIVADLIKEFAGAKVHYWISPVSDYGNLKTC